MKKGIDFVGNSIIYICHDGQGHYLMQKRGIRARDEHNTWDFGGGALELGDTVAHTLRKEIKEEYGTTVLNYEFLGFRGVHREHQGQKTHWIALDFKVLVDRSQVRNGEPDKFDEIGWFSLDKMPEMLHSQLPFFLNKYKDKL